MVTMNAVNEQKRTYLFADAALAIEGVEAVGISNTTHRINCTNGDKYIVANGWKAIKLEGITDWSF